MPLTFKLSPDREVGGGNPCFIIAEIGINHQGDMEIAKSMITKAKECGADCVKFQKSDLSSKFNKKALLRPYPSKHSWGETYGEHKRHLEFSHEQYRELQKHAKAENILFTASAMDEKSVDFLNEIDVPFIKVGSNDTNNFPYLVKTAKTGKPMVVSSGMQSLETMRKVYETIKPHNEKFVFLQCTSCYPLDFKNVNLKVIPEYQKEFPDIPIGYSGHETGIAVSLAAVAMGAKVLERHFTLDKRQKGNDHAASLEPDEFKQMVDSIRDIEEAMGKGLKRILPCEEPFIKKLGKSVVAKVNLKKGETLTADKLAVKVAEPRGIPAEDIFDVLNKTVLEDVEEDETIMPDVVENYCKKTKC